MFLFFRRATPNKTVLGTAGKFSKGHGQESNTAFPPFI